MAATIPALPLSPATTSTRAVIINVMIVIPLTGLVPTIAMALAATVVKRNEMTATIISPRSACQILLTTPPNAKKQNTARSVNAMPHTTVFIGRSCCVRSAAAAADGPLRWNSEAARPMALFITPALFMIPIIPAVAIPPIPICLAYSLNIWSGDICEIGVVIPIFIRSITSPPQIRFMRGIITSHTRNEPQQMINAYLSPTM